MAPGTGTALTVISCEPRMFEPLSTSILIFQS
ncbi:MAG: hypothetical protein RJA12_92, partial [Planctomycetota bacterium]